MHQGEGRFKSQKHYERVTEARRYFDLIAQAYVEFREYAPVCACIYDPAQRPKKLNSTIITFLCDVDLATSRVLTPELIQQWEALITGEEVDSQVSAFIVNRCARIYQARKLAPFIYFRSIKQPVARGAA